MNIKELNNRNIDSADDKLAKTYTQFEELLSELKKRELPENIIMLINECIDQINLTTHTGTPLKTLIKVKQAIILKQVEKQNKVVPKNYYRNMWMLLGFTAFGLPIGVAFGLSLHNIGLLGIGLPIGMAIGLAVGSSLDKKAAAEGRQLDIEIKN